MSSRRYWLCWSSRQGCFHIESESEGLRINRAAFNRNTRIDYIPIAVFDSESAASHLAATLIDRLKDRQVQPKQEAKWN